MSKEFVHYHGRIRIPYKWAAGETASRFFRELRDHEKLWATHCSGCGLTHFPPKKVCHQCFRETNSWVEVGRRGKLVSFTTVHYYEKNVHPLKPPFRLGLIKLHEADTAFIHFLGECGSQDLRTGMEVEAVLGYDRKGDMMDISYFRPIDQTEGS